MGSPITFTQTGNNGCHTAPSLRDPRVIVAIDFGTTFSTFTYAFKSDPSKIYVFQTWPLQEELIGRPYAKTSTSLWYLRDAGDYQCQDFAWPAVDKYSKCLRDLRLRKGRKGNLSPDKEADIVGVLVQRFKLGLFNLEHVDIPSLPNGLSFETAIVDYLFRIGVMVREELQNSGNCHIEDEDIQWALSVPTLWSEKAKKKMKLYAEKACLLKRKNSKKDGSHHPVQILLEPEAASVYCQKHAASLLLEVGSKFLVVDCGGGTVDIVGHEKMSGREIGRVKEITQSVGDLCGATFIDEAFEQFLKERIKCFEEEIHRNPVILATIRKNWEKYKCSFRDDDSDFHFDLPRSLAEAWEKNDKLIGEFHTDYDSIVLDRERMRSLFDPTVNRVIELIKQQLRKIQDCEVIACAGGFSNSKYLMKRIHENFGNDVRLIVNPPGPESAVCVGAVQLCLYPELMVARVVKKTYGISITRAFAQGDPLELLFHNENGNLFCKDVFHVFATCGEEIGVDTCVVRNFFPTSADQVNIKLDIFSTDSKNPGYIGDPGVKWEEGFDFPIPDTTMGKDRKIEVSMFFGRSMIEVKAKALNFGNNEELAQKIILSTSFGLSE